MPEILAVVEEYRGLRFKSAVPWGFLSKADFTKRLLADSRDGSLADQAADAAYETALKAFGLIPPEMKLADYLPKLMGEQIAGFYDSKRKELTLVNGENTLFGTGERQRLGARESSAEQEGLLIHELTHALQDQHFDLEKFSPPDDLSDAARSRIALVEGDATLPLVADMAGVQPSALPLLGDTMKKVLDDPRRAMTAMMGAPNSAELAAAPAWLRETLMFTYFQGFEFCARVLAQGGQRLLDYAFTTDPPRSTEQILHPEKWYGRRDDPTVISWPDLTASLPGSVRLATGQLGELGIRILLNQSMKDSPRAAAAAAGWGGDEFAVYRRPRAGDAAPNQGSAPTLLAWITEWDAEEGAVRFAAAAGRLGPGWDVHRTGRRRVVILRGEITSAERTAVLAKLAAAPAQVAANHAVDPAAVDPERRIGDTGPRIASRIAARRRALLTPDRQLSEVRLSDDRSSYSFPAIGLTMRLPIALTSWQTRTSPTKAILLMMTDQRQEASLTVTAIDLHQNAGGIDLAVPFLEQGLKGSMPNFVKLYGRLVQIAGQPAYELRFLAGPNGAQMESQFRAFARGSQVVTVGLSAKRARWGDIEPLANELLNGLAVTPPPSASESSPAPASPPAPPSSLSAAAPPTPAPVH